MTKRAQSDEESEQPECGVVLRSPPKSLLKCSLAALATAALATSGVAATGTSTSAHSHAHHHHSSSSHYAHHPAYSEYDESDSSFGSTVRRISLNILNSSSSAIESLRSSMEPRSSSAAGSYAGHHRIPDAGHVSSKGPHSSASSSQSTTTTGPVSSALTSTYSYLSDLFPRLSPPSTTTEDYLLDDYDTTDSVSGGSALDSMVLDHPEPSTASPASSSTELFMRLLRNVTSDATRSQHHLVHREYDSSYDPARGVAGAPFPSHLLSDPVVASSSSYSSSASSSSVSPLLPSLSSSVAASTATRDSSSSQASSSSPFHTLYDLFQRHSPCAHNCTTSSNASRSPAALTSSQMSAPSSYLSSSASLLDSTLSANTSSFNLTSLVVPSVLANATTTAAASSISSTTLASTSTSAAYYASELASSFASTMMTEEATAVSRTGSQMDSWDIVILVLKCIVLGGIIISAVLGNLLVIVSVMKHRKLRITTNYFIVSLALADMLVAIFAMTFNASVIIVGGWIFDWWVCDFWNSCDVLFSTASIMHLSCISYDRYYAIIKPFEYQTKIENSKRVYYMLAAVWVSSALISYIPIFTGIYTTTEAMENRYLNPDTCEWVVNIPYALISSTVSFWLPCSIMLIAYYKIFKEATKQEKFIYKTQQIANVGNNHHHHHANHHKKQEKKQPKSSDEQHLNVQRHSSASENNVINIHGGHRNSHADDPESGSSTPTKRTISKMKREHKAAKTLGIIMGAFIACWLPFFIWYVTSTICGEVCSPKLLVDILFWVGYLNSAMNPIIYAYFNREFREAFKKTLRDMVFCWCELKCLEPHRDREAIAFAYRSNTDVGLVENKYAVKD